MSATAAEPKLTIIQKLEAFGHEALTALFVFALLLGGSTMALAQAVVAMAPIPPFDFTPVAVALVGGMFSIVGLIVNYQIDQRMKNKTAAATIENAVNNSLGVGQQAIVAGLQQHPLQMLIPGVTASTAAMVQHVLDNAGPELARFPEISPADIASKINAKIGLKEIATNQAIAANNTPVVPAPLGPVPVLVAPQPAA